MLPRDMLERFLDGPFNYEELRKRVNAYVGDNLAGQERRTMELMLDNSTSPNEDDEDVKCRAAPPTPATQPEVELGVKQKSRHFHEARERGHKTECAQEETPRVHCPEDVDEVGTEQSSDADSDLFGLGWRHEHDVSINSVVSQKDQAQRG